MITGKHVEQVLRSIPGAYGRQVAGVDELATGANEALLTAPAGLTVEGAASFLATMAQESASFRATEEYAKNGRYAPFIGRTFEMVTWRDNYERFGGWCVAQGLLKDNWYFTEKPQRLADLRWAWLGGIWFWQQHGIWAHGNRGDFLATQRAVNLGSPTSKHTPVGMTARNAWYAAWLRIGADLLPTPTEQPTKGLPLMATTAKSLYKRRTADQVFIDPGQHQLEVDDKKPGDKSLAFGPNDAVAIGSSAVITSAAGGVLRLVLVDYAEGEDTTVHHQRLGQSFPAGARVEVAARYDGSIGKAPEKGHSLRLRVAVESTGPVTVHDVQSTGFTL